MKRERGGHEPDTLADDAGGKSGGALFDQQAVDGQSIFMGERAQRVDDIGGFHGCVRYYDYYRNINRRVIDACVLLGIYLASIELDANAIGVVIGPGLAGAATGTRLVTFLSDRFGRRRTLLVITGLSVQGALLLAVASSPFAMGFAAFIGMVNGMGRDRDAAPVVEQSVLPATWCAWPAWPAWPWRRGSPGS